MAVDRSQMDIIMDQAQEAVATKGTGASDREIMLGGFGWLADRLAPPSNGRTRRQTLAQVGTPVVAGGGLATIILLALREVLSL